MSEANWRASAIALAAVLVVLVAIAVVISLPAGTTGPGATPTGPIAGASAGASPGGPSAPPSIGPSALPSAAGSRAPSPPPPASPSASPTARPTAAWSQITFTDFRLDAASDADGKPRIFSFTTDGPGTVTARLVARNPKRTSRFCLRVGSSATICRNWLSGTLTGTTSAAGQTRFTVTLRGVGGATPTVDLALTFRSRAPSVTLTNGRFDGTASEAVGYNGMNGQVKVRTGGQISVKAGWGGKPFDYTYSLVDLADPTGGGVFPGNGTGIERTDPATATHTYGFGLVNGETGFGRTPMTMTIAWR
jgi:hypothetical protein